MKKFVKNKQLIISLLVLITLVCVLQISVKGESEVKEDVKTPESIQGKISEELKNKVQKASDSEKISVSVWIKDIDYKTVEESSVKKLSLTDNNKQSEEYISDYIKTTRATSLYYHKLNNEGFYDEIAENVDVINIDMYSPNLILNVDTDYLTELSKNEKVVKIDLFANDTKVIETANSIPAITADYTKNLGLTGNGVNIGILEYSNDDHAQTVKNIVEDIVPDSNVIMKYAHNKAEDYAMIAELITEGVNVINYSAGYSADPGVYTDFAEYIDYIVENYDITFVKSSGNVMSNNLVTDPGMAYNGITVGSINENDTSTWTDDILSSFSCYEELGGASKPDFSAPGEGIYGDKDGTSYSAPHVVGVIAQLMDLNPVLKSYPSAVKSVLATGTWHQTADDYGNNLWSPYYSNKEGAGVVDATGSYNVLNNSNFHQAVVNNNQFSYEGTFYVYSINSDVRIALSWLKQDNLSDLDFRIYDPNDNLVGYSLSSTNNTELIEFNPRYYRGTYKFVIEGYSLSNSTEDICVSWQQK
ncbi:MAG: S8 family serine peptidase [Clostridiales bacterium]